MKIIILKHYHTNASEDFIWLIKGVKVRIHNFASLKHLENYLNEFTFRYSSRENAEENKFNLFSIFSTIKR